MLWGVPDIGKSALIAQVFKEIKAGMSPEGEGGKTVTGGMYALAQDIENNFEIIKKEIDKLPFLRSQIIKKEYQGQAFPVLKYKGSELSLFPVYSINESGLLEDRKPVEKLPSSNSS